MEYGARHGIVPVPKKDSCVLTAQEKENVRSIKEQFSTVLSHFSGGSKSALHLPELDMAHCRPCLGRLIALAFAPESSIRCPRERTVESSFYLPPASRSPQLLIGRRPSNDG
jgi:hypothetical protein